MELGWIYLGICKSPCSFHVLITNPAKNKIFVSRSCMRISNLFYSLNWFQHTNIANAGISFYCHEISQAERISEATGGEGRYLTFVLQGKRHMF